MGCDRILLANYELSYTMEDGLLGQKEWIQASHMCSTMTQLSQHAVKQIQ